MGYHADLLAGKGIQVHRLDIERERLPFEPESVDVVIANQILEHVKELFWVLHETARVLRVGGAMVVGVPNLASLHNRALLMLGRQPTSITVASAHVRGFTRRGLAGLLRAAAPGVLEIERFAGSNFYPFPGCLARPLARVFPGMAVSAFFLIRKRAAYSGQVLEFVERSRFETNYFVGRNGR
jgi:SAM-dependent methyltransferase